MAYLSSMLPECGAGPVDRFQFTYQEATCAVVLYGQEFRRSDPVRTVAIVCACGIDTSRTRNGRVWHAAWLGGNAPCCSCKCVLSEDTPVLQYRSVLRQDT